MDLPKIITYVVVGTITGWLFGRHVYKCSINPNRPDLGGDKNEAIWLGFVGGLFWQVTWLWAIFKALTDGSRR